MISRPPAYLHVIQRYYPFRGGSERFFQAFSERFARDGARVQVVTSDAWDLEYFWDPRRKRIDETCGSHNGVDIRRVPVRHLPAASLTHRAIRRLMAESSRISIPGKREFLDAGSRFGPWLPTLDDELRKLDRPDLINSANIAFESMIAAGQRYARDRDIPHVITPFLHLGEPGDRRVRRYYTMPHQIDLLRHADAVMVLTDMESEYLTSVGINDAKIRVVGAGIDVDSVTGGDGASMRVSLGIDGAIVLALGAAAFDKGTIHLIEAVSQLRRDGEDVHLVIAGPIMSEVDRFSKTLSGRDREGIHILGFVSDEERRDLLAAATVLALPSRTESFGLVFMEAWANSLPVIGARAGAIPSVVSDEEDGLLVDFGDVPGLARAIKAIVDSSSLAAELGRCGRSKVVTEDKWFERIRDLYISLLGPSAARSGEGM